MRATNPVMRATNPIMRATNPIMRATFLAWRSTYLALSATYLVLSRSLAGFYCYLSRFKTPKKWDGGSIIKLRIKISKKMEFQKTRVLSKFVLPKSTYFQTCKRALWVCQKVLLDVKKSTSRVEKKYSECEKRYFLAHSVSTKVCRKKYQIEIKESNEWTELKGSNELN